MDRRSFLAGLSAFAAWPARADLILPPSSTPVAGGLVELSSRPSNYESTRATFVQRLTPTQHFYVRSHFDTPVIDASTWRLTIDGLVDQPLSLSLAELEQMPQTTVEAVLQCAGNGRALFRPRMPGVQWQRGAMGNAQWRGVRLGDLLRRSRPRAAARHAHLQGADRPMLPTTPTFVRALPIDKALHEDTLVALSMNGRPLPRLHGAPARLIVPGWVADGWTKWLNHISVADVEPEGFFFQTAYRFPKTEVAPGVAVPAENMAPMSTLGVKSVIASPSDDLPLRPGRHEIVGVAFSGGAGIAKVEVRINNGAWLPTHLDGPSTPYGFRLFRAPFEAALPGHYQLHSRAVDDKGAVQPEQPRWNPSGYLYNAIDPVSVEVRA